MAWQILRRFPLEAASGQQSLRRIPNFDSMMPAIDRQNPHYGKIGRPILREKEKFIG
jgi:hypothetical protein